MDALFAPFRKIFALILLVIGMAVYLIGWVVDMIIAVFALTLGAIAFVCMGFWKLITRKGNKE